MDETLKKHWTAAKSDDFLYKVAADFALQIENYLESGPDNQTTLAQKLNVTPARVSQVLNNPGNMTLRLIVEYVLALGKKVAIVAYDDDDAANAKGPINSQVFERCWRRAGRPTDFFAIEDADANAITGMLWWPTSPFPVPIGSTPSKANVATTSYRPSETAGTHAGPGLKIEQPTGATTHG